MDPILVRLGPLVIRWYGVMMAVTIVTGLLAAYRLGSRFGVDARAVDRLSVLFIILAFVGARLGYVVSHPAEFTDPLEILRIDHGGLTSHGAIAGGLLALGIAARRGGPPFWDLADTVVWTVPLGNIFVRFGNFMNGELYGDPTSLPWAVTFPGVPGPRHPLQLYEMFFAVLILAVTVPMSRRRAFPGQLFWTVLVLTSAGRIVLDLLRSEDRIYGIVTLGQIPAALLIVLGLVFLSRGRRAGTRR
ncbi:MAG: prolipoprotein diacylglyceryl transferase [Armatimonadota bacterium]|nr:prolipoprotein diacylglyceryl transferase [Armatimonadota bacterium]MDR7499704.1 prolipoprotein diacylglyceryl transferase [Armatimonadota bacterium]MDR7553064.1 prolipoprotein diacylglyceryl transferase [Armatimonadota bacterium]MDR7558571.1 prolipoprotein diacylglyceryl transferase [Armatimonadota bacterium]MDR7573287.1 prolipoprotein diacylglyceryl transferase [Armatimonadota bacterium]